MSKIDTSVRFPFETIFEFMPMALVLSNDMSILACGPTIAKVIAFNELQGLKFQDVFEVILPKKFQFSDLSGTRIKIRLNLCNGQLRKLKGQISRIPNSSLILVNLSFGSSVNFAIENFNLVVKDFSPADSAMDLAYIVEVQKAVLTESRKVTSKLFEDRNLANKNADTDVLTGIANRRGLNVYINRLIDRVDQNPFTLILLDLDRFKHVNDGMGHDAGDEVLREVSIRLKKLIRPMDLVARTGGDEFVIVLNGMDIRQDVEKLARRFISEIEQPIDFDSTICNVSASIGVMSIRDHKDIERAFKVVDAALYHSKNNGRGCITFAKDVA